MEYASSSTDAPPVTKHLVWLRIAAAVASGLMVAGLFPPFDFSALVWVAMMPLLWALSGVRGRRRGWKGFAIGYLAGAVSCLIQFNWVNSVSWLGALLLPLYLAVYWGLFGCLAVAILRPGTRSSWRTAFGLAAAWVALEWLRGWVLTGFSWNVMGVAFHELRVIAQAADLFGVLGLSLAIVFFQALLVQAVQEKSGRLRNLGVAALLVISLYGYGKVRISIEKNADSVRLKTLLVQLNIPQEAGRVLWTDLETHQGYEDETLKGLNALKNADGSLSPQWPDWVMWPECALTGRILFTAAGETAMWQINHDTISQVREAGPFSLIYGVNEQEAEKDGDVLAPMQRGRVYNSIAVMSPENILQTYRKQHLVIFGETIPFVDSVPWLKRIYEQQAGAAYYGSFAEGESLEPVPLLAGGTTLGAIPTVCFEDSVPRLTRKFTRPGPQVIINVTNDGWFKQSAAAAQHFAYARFRAIELRRPMLRSANTGVSAAIDSTGSTAHPDTGVSQVLVDAKGSHFTRGSLLTELNVPLRPSFSLYERMGDFGLLGLLTLALVLTCCDRKST
jgi:apolipoprotein N-acyltransferase